MDRKTSMGLCIADSLIEKREFDPRDIMMRFILWWCYGYNNTFRFDNKRSNKASVGLSGTTKQSLLLYIKNKGNNVYTKYGDKNSSGNGSLIRNAAIPICYFRNKEKAIEFAKKQSSITHQGDQAAGCCQLLTYIIIKILNLKGKNTNTNSLNAKTYFEKSKISISKNQEDLKLILDNLKDFKCKSVQALLFQEKNDKNKDWNWRNDDFKYNEERARYNPNIIGSYCMDGFAMALHILYTTNSFKEAILKSANLCGDSGAVSSIVGQIAGAYYGLDYIPKDWIKTINQWDNNEIALRGYILCHLDEMNIYN